MCDLGTKIRVRNLSVAHDGVGALFDVSLDIASAGVTVILGPGEAGKTTLLRALTRLHVDGSVCASGSVRVRGDEIYSPGVDLAALHRRIGMVLSEPWLFPGSIETNVAYGLRVAGVRDDDLVGAAVAEALRAVGLWSRVGTDLGGSPANLTREEQRRLCIARALVLEPEVLLLDDPARDLDRLPWDRTEQLIDVLRARTTIVVTTRDARQAARFGDEVVFLAGGRVVEAGAASEVLNRPTEAETAKYIQACLG